MGFSNASCTLFSFTLHRSQPERPLIVFTEGGGVKHRCLMKGRGLLDRKPYGAWKLKQEMGAKTMKYLFLSFSVNFLMCCYKRQQIG